ncbi:hypothetical protein M405DRAFT_526466 [Rhizopogon salebrosus TDB-379]|nr:hypothetical protein M405DRAFT_526466 [Rhizopogon salebrosus TDB-379]
MLCVIARVALLSVIERTEIYLNNLNGQFAIWSAFLTGARFSGLITLVSAMRVAYYTMSQN